MKYHLPGTAARIFIAPFLPLSAGSGTTDRANPIDGERDAPQSDRAVEDGAHTFDADDIFQTEGEARQEAEAYEKEAAEEARSGEARSDSDGDRGGVLYDPATEDPEANEGKVGDGGNEDEAGEKPAGEDQGAKPSGSGGELARIGDMPTEQGKSPDAAASGGDTQEQALARLAERFPDTPKPALLAMLEQEAALSQWSHYHSALTGTEQGRALDHYLRTGQQLPSEGGGSTPPEGAAPAESRKPEAADTGLSQEDLDKLEDLFNEGRGGEAIRLLSEKVTAAAKTEFDKAQNKQASERRAHEFMREHEEIAGREIAELDSVLGAEWNGRYGAAALKTQERGPGLRLAECVVLQAVAAGDMNTVKRFMPGTHTEEVLRENEIETGRGSEPSRRGSDGVSAGELAAMRELGYRQPSRSEADDTFDITD